MPANNPGFSGGAATDLGLGDMLAGQVAGETEEQRKKRMLELQQKQMLGPAGSLAVTSIFGMGGGSKSAGY